MTDTLEKDAPERRDGPDGRARRRRVVAGTAMVLAGASLWGLSGTVTKLLMDRTGTDAVWLTDVKMLLGSAVFFCCAALATPDRLRGAVRALARPTELARVLVIERGDGHGDAEPGCAHDACGHLRARAAAAVCV